MYWANTFIYVDNRILRLTVVFSSYWRFSFQIKPNGEILKVYHPPEDDEVLETKKGLAGMLAAKMHDKEEVSYTDVIIFTEMLFTESGN